MGLKEKQFMASADFSWHLDRIKRNTGTDIGITIDEKSAFSNDIEALFFVENRGAQVVGDAFERIITDDISKQAVQELNLKTILLRHVPGGRREVEIKDGILTLSHDFLADSSSDRWDGGSLYKHLEGIL
jgi:hypothetical protein